MAFIFSLFIKLYYNKLSFSKILSMKKTVYFCFIFISIMFLNSCLNDSKDEKELNIINNKEDVEYKIDSLMSLMTLKEKIGQMNMYNGFWDVTGPAPTQGNGMKKYDDLRNGFVGAMLNVRGAKNVREVQKIAVQETRLGIPLLIGFDVIHGYKTLSPIPLAEAASWDLDAIKNSARMAATEASAAGINWTFAPMVDISRDARWGRVMEGGGEDPYLASKIATARVQGFQGDDLSLTNTIAACAKHFAAYGFSESGREYNTVDIGTSTLYNVVLPPFLAAKEANVKTFMNAFNTLNDVPATADILLQRDLLKLKWEFKGFVVSDWASISQMIPHGFAKNGRDAALLAARGGCDMDMESYMFLEHLEDLIMSGEIKESIVDEAVKRILRVKFELGLFENPYKYCDENREQEIIGNEEFNEQVLDLAKKSIVLLKNENNILPLKKEGLNIAVIGELAYDKTSPLGSWRIASDDSTAVSVLEGLSKYPNNKITYTKGVDVYTGDKKFTLELNINEADKNGFIDAIKIAKKSDVVIMVLGEHGFLSGEARSRTQLDLPGLQQELLEEIHAVNKNVILVLNNGRPLILNWAAENIPAIVEAWQLGTQSGNAIAQVIYGDYNPSGKLPMTFPRSLGQVPIYYNRNNTGRPVLLEGEPSNAVWWSHYVDESNDPLYPFGYGLSYTTFSYNNLMVSTVGDDTIEVKVSVKNTGNRKGKEVVQLYIRDVVASSVRPVKELKSFELVELEPNEEKSIQFNLTKDELGYYTTNGEFIFEPGEFYIFVGGNSMDTLKSKIVL